MSKVVTVYDEMQHCVSTKYPQEKTVGTDCPYTGKGEEFSPGNLVEAALAGCILLSMGPVAIRGELDLSGARVDVSISMADKPPMRFGAIDVTINMPRNFGEKDRAKLERAAEMCPIKHSFDPDIPITVRFNYPE